MKVSNYLDADPILDLPGVVKREVINADDERLQKVGKVGPVKAKKIKEITDSEYKI